jgi:hypothetical protein
VLGPTACRGSYGSAPLGACGAASIAAKGVLQPLVIEPELGEGGDPTGNWLVTIGEGRRQALRLLASRKRIKKTHLVRCVVVINTNRRTYHLDLSATVATAMVSVAWRYPQDEQRAALESDRAKAAEMALQRPAAAGDLNFGYRIEGARPVWRPSRVFDDGRQTVIEFPAAIALCCASRGGDPRSSGDRDPLRSAGSDCWSGDRERVRHGHGSLPAHSSGRPADRDL